jgi:hypothetical protein
MTPYSRARAYEHGLTNMLEQFLDKRRIPAASAILLYLHDPDNRSGVPRKRLIDDVSGTTTLNHRRVERTLADLKRVGFVRDVGAVRTVSIYVASPSYLGASLGFMASELDRIEKGLKFKVTKEQIEEGFKKVRT